MLSRRMELHDLRCAPPFFRALDALAVDDRGGRARLASGGFPALDVERLVDALERAVPTPKVEVIVEGRARRQILRDGAPLAAGAENVHEAVDNLAYVDVALVAAAFGRRNQRFDMPPLGVGQIARIAQPAAVIASAVFLGPHWRPLRRFGPPLLNHKRFQRFVKFSDRLLELARRPMQKSLPASAESSLSGALRHCRPGEM